MGQQYPGEQPVPSSNASCHRQSRGLGAQSLWAVDHQLRLPECPCNAVVLRPRPLDEAEWPLVQVTLWITAWVYAASFIPMLRSLLSALFTGTPVSGFALPTASSLAAKITHSPQVCGMLA